MNQQHLFLTSSGLSDDMKRKFFEIIGKDPDKIKILYIPTAGIETDEAREGIAVCLYELSRMGILYENILIYNLELLVSKDYRRTYSSYIHQPSMLTRLLTAEEMETFDAVFVSGGDSDVLCREMVRTGFGRTLASAINNSLIYVGISAGSMYAAGNLDEGLHIIPNPIIPHWTGDKLTELPGGKEPIRLTDGQAIYIETQNINLL